MKRFLGTFIGKSIFLAEKLMHKNASSFPGKAVLALFPDYLKKIKYPPLTVMVTGSCGKGSTTRIIAEALRENGSTVAHNLEGSNLLNGVASTVIKNISFSGKLKQNALVLEVDERYLKLITKYIIPDYLVINNLTRDQPPRQGDFDIVFGEIECPERVYVAVQSLFFPEGVWNPGVIDFAEPASAKIGLQIVLVYAAFVPGDGNRMIRFNLVPFSDVIVQRTLCGSKHGQCKHENRRRNEHQSFFQMVLFH